MLASSSFQSSLVVYSSVLVFSLTHCPELMGDAVKTGLCSSSTRLEAAAHIEKPVQKFKRKKDLSASIASSVMKQLRSHEKAQNLLPLLNTFGKFIAEYVSVYISTGVRDKSKLTFGFDLERWNSRKKKGKREGTKIDAEEKAALIEFILQTIHRRISTYYLMEEGDIMQLYQTKRDHFLALRMHMEIILRKGNGTGLSKEENANIRKLLYLMRRTLLASLHPGIIGHLEPAEQDTLMRWAFRNECRFETLTSLNVCQRLTLQQSLDLSRRARKPTRDY